jgi:DNA-binding MarR family transcriptional regulator
MNESISPRTQADEISAVETRALLKSIRRIVRANDLQSRALAKSTGLTGPQLVILMAVAELGEVTTKALADHADLSPATVVTVLDNLEQRAIVERYRSGIDRRIVYTRLTPRGQELISHAPRVFGGGFVRRFAALSPDRRRRLVSSVAELAELMNARA